MANNLDKVLFVTKELISLKKYDEALNILLEESKNALYTLEEQEIIESKANQLKKFIKQNEWIIRLDSADKSTLIKIFNTEGYEFPVLDTLLEKFAKDLNKTDLLKLQQVFLDDDVSNESKIICLKAFQEYEIKHVFNFHNASIDKTFDVDTSKSFDLDAYDLLFIVKDNLKAIYFKETSKEKLAYDIINAIYFYYFNQFDLIKYNADDLFNSIVDYVDHAFNNITPVKEEFNKWINKILEK